MTKYQLPQLLIDNIEKLPKEQQTIIKDRNWITTNDLIFINQNYLTSIPLSNLLKNLKFYKEPVKSTYTPQFQKQLERLKIQQQELEYQTLINKDYDPEETLTPSQMTKEINSQITTIFNILVSTLSVGYAIWYWSNSSGYFPLHIRVFLTLFFTILTLVAEVVVFNSFIRKVDEAKTKEKKKKEVKKIISTVVL